jgi:hypothetical protein
MSLVSKWPPGYQDSDIGCLIALTMIFIVSAIIMPIPVMASAASFTSLVPIFFLLPFLPVPFHVAVRYPFVSRRQAMTIILWQRSQSAGNSSGLYVTPLPVIIPGSVPVPFIRTPPVALKKQNIHINVRDHVNICSRYYNHLRRSSIPDCGEIGPYTYINPSLPYMYIYPSLIYIYLCLTLGYRSC